MNAISVKDLSKTYTIIQKKGLLKNLKIEKKAVDNISFSIEKGEILGFIGPNGAGKSTTIKMMSGILRPTSGDISILSLDPQKQRKKLAYKIGTVFGQKSQLWIHLPPYDTFQLLGKIYDLPKNILKQKIEEFTEYFDLSDIIYQPVRKLSLGQRIRCEIASSLLHEPEILFLDEPTIGLDIIVKKNIRDLILEMNKKYRTTIILTSHDVSDIEKLCDRTIIINNGKIVYEDSVKILKYNFLQKKLISLKTENEINLSIDGIEILKEKKYSAKIEINTKIKPLHEYIDRLIQLNNVLDINISDIPLEEIIGNIYKTTGKTENGGTGS